MGAPRDRARSRLALPGARACGARARRRARVPGLDVRVELAAGLSGGGLGTDATEIAAAVGRADDGDGILVLTDLGSGIMSAETALELLDPGVAARVRLSPAPLVEGLVGAYAAAGIGKTLDVVAAEAETAIEAKRVQLTT